MPRKPRERRVRSLRDGGAGDPAHAAAGALAGGDRADTGRARADVRDDLSGVDHAAGGGGCTAAQFSWRCRALYPSGAPYIVEVRRAAAATDAPALITELANNAAQAPELAAQIIHTLELLS